MVAPCNRATIYIFILSFVLLSFFLSSPNLRRRRLDVCHASTQRGLSANLECRSETCCTQLAENAGCKKKRQELAICAPSHNFVGLYLRK